MSKQRALTEDQERQRTEGLRVLARIIARRHLAEAELVPAPTGDADGGNGDRKEAAE